MIFQRTKNLEYATKKMEELNKQIDEENKEKVATVEEESKSEAEKEE
jgi:hypothetical protein